MVRLMSASSRPQRRAEAKAKAKPKARRQKSSGGGGTDSIMAIFDNVEKGDMMYMKTCFEQSPALVPWIASLLRDGSLLQSLARKQAGEQPLCLGKRIPVKCKRYRHLPPRFWELVWVNLGVCEASEFEVKSNKLPLLKHQEVAEWALRMSLDAFLARNHKAADFEGPLIAVLQMRHNDVGSRLRTSQLRYIKSRLYGYFHIPDEFEGEVIICGQRGLMLTATTQELAATATDWELEENTNHDARLVSRSLAFSQGLFCLLFSQRPELRDAPEFAPHDDGVEFPDAANAFPDPKSYDSAAKRLVNSDGGNGAQDGVTTVSPGGTVTVTPVKRRRSIMDSPSAIVPFSPGA